MTVASHMLYRDLRPKFSIDKSVARELLSFSKYTMPSSFLTLGLTQFDKVIFLRLFDLRLLGIYNLAGNIVGVADNLVTKISQSVLYPRAAHNFRRIARAQRSDTTLRIYASLPESWQFRLASVAPPTS